MRLACLLAVIYASQCCAFQPNLGATSASRLGTFSPTEYCRPEPAAPALVQANRWRVVCRSASTLAHDLQEAAEEDEEPASQQDSRAAHTVRVNFPAPAESKDKEEAGSSVDLFARTWESLDFGAVLAALSEEAKTGMGRRKALVPDFKTELADVHEAYKKVEEVLALSDDVPLRGGMDIEPLIELAERGTTLEPPEIVAVSDALAALQELRDFFIGPEADERPSMPLLTTVASAIELAPDLVALLQDAFDAEGELCGRKFPEIGRLRKEAKSLEDGIRSTLQRLLAGRSLDGMLADEGRSASYVTEVNGRFCVPIKPTHKRGVGIVHDRSRTGRTLFVEPQAVVEPTNELAEVKLQLRAEIRRVLARMTTLIASNRFELRASLRAAESIDLTSARARLGRRLRGVVPEVSDQGRIFLENARHPVLCLRGINPVGNDLSLDGSQPSLVLTGPNAGGKTVVLKTLGLVALMTRAGIPIPARIGARVDLFDPVLADIGDLQSVAGDLSTFSGHLVVANAVLKGARAGALVLMDEMGSGTDPAQGAALAQALLEALIDAGARVALTTHFLQLKELAIRDSRFAVAAMQFADGRPTYRMRMGAVGESFALAVAERLKLPAPVLGRARELLDENVRQVSDLVQELEQQRETLAAETKAIEAERVALQRREAAATAATREAQRLKQVARAEAAAEYAEVISAQEVRLKELLEAIRSEPSVDIVGSSIGELRAVRRAALAEANSGNSDLSEDSEFSAGLKPLEAGQTLSVGDKVVVLARGIAHLREGTVQSLRRGGSIVDVAIGGMATMRLKPEELSFPPPPGTASSKAKTSGNTGRGSRRAALGAGGVGRRLSKRVAQYLEQEPISQPRRGGTSAAGAAEGGGVQLTYMRTEGNTLDLRGKTLDEATDACDRYFNAAIMSGRSVVYVLHGHGTGVLKKGLREWLPSNGCVKRAKPASQSDGGDAFTIVELR